MVSQSPELDELIGKSSSAQQNIFSAPHKLQLRNPYKISSMQSTSGAMSGVPMAQQQATTPSQAPQQIKDLRPSVTTSINLTFIVLEKGPLSRIGEAGPLVSIALVADATAAVHLQLWGPECDAFQPGDIVRLTNGVFSFHKTNLVLRAGKKGALEKSGEFTMVFSENVNMSKLQWVPDPVNAKQWNPVGFNPHSPQGSQYHHGALLGIPRGPFH